VRALFLTPASYPSNLPSSVQTDRISARRRSHALPRRTRCSPLGICLGPDVKRLAVTISSKMIGGLMGLTLSPSLPQCSSTWLFPALAEQISRDPGLIFLSGILLFVPLHCARSCYLDGRLADAGNGSPLACRPNVLTHLGGPPPRRLVTWAFGPRI
jgi:hypothetical protein